MDDIHRWNFQLWMRLLHLWMTSMDDTFFMDEISPPMGSISPSIYEISSNLDGIFICHVFHSSILEFEKICGSVHLFLCWKIFQHNVSMSVLYLKMSGHYTFNVCPFIFWWKVSYVFLFRNCHKKDKNGLIYLKFNSLIPVLTERRRASKGQCR